MPATMVRARHLITRTLDRRSHAQIDDAALVQEGGVIAEIGPYADLRARFPDMAVLGDGGQVVLPGLVNAHHHVGLTPVQLGSPDMPLELWFVTRLVCRSPDLRLDTLYSAFEMLASGVTTVQHIHGWIPGGAIHGPWGRRLDGTGRPVEAVPSPSAPPPGSRRRRGPRR